MCDNQYSDRVPPIHPRISPGVYRGGEWPKQHLVTTAFSHSGRVPGGLCVWPPPMPCKLGRPFAFRVSLPRVPLHARETLLPRRAERACAATASWFAYTRCTLQGFPRLRLGRRDSVPRSPPPAGAGLPLDDDHMRSVHGWWRLPLRLTSLLGPGASCRATGWTPVPHAHLPVARLPTPVVQPPLDDCAFVRFPCDARTVARPWWWRG